MVDDDLWWLYCGTECRGHFIGPFPEWDQAHENAEGTGCPHDHAVLRMTLQQMVSRLPKQIRLWDAGIFDPTPTPSRLLVSRPKFPLEAAERWPVFAAGMVKLKEWA